MLIQAYDGWWPNSAGKSPLGKYQALKTLGTKVFVQVCKRQPCFARRAVLKALKSPNPNPPSSFGRHILSHLSQAILDRPQFCPH